MFKHTISYRMTNNKNVINELKVYIVVIAFKLGCATHYF